MKKIVILILALVSVLLSCISCGIRKEYAVYEVGGYDYSSGADHNEEYSLQWSKSVDFKLLKEKTVGYGEREYEVSYEYTEEGYLYNSGWEMYSQQDGLNCIKFGINKNSNRVDFYSWIDMDYTKNTALVEKSREECLELAKEYLSSYVDDIEEYKIIDEHYREIPEYGAIYDFDYARMIDNVRTADVASVNITIYGTVVHHRFESFGEMKGAKLPEQEKMEAIQADVEKKLDGIYETIKDEYYSVTYELDEMVFERLADGRYALEYWYDVQLYQLEESSIPIREMTRLIVILEDV